MLEKEKNHIIQEKINDKKFDETLKKKGYG